MDHSRNRTTSSNKPLTWLLSIGVGLAAGLAILVYRRAPVHSSAGAPLASSPVRARSISAAAPSPESQMTRSPSDPEGLQRAARAVSQLSATLPSLKREPLAYRGLIDRKISPIDSYNAESRDPVWAPAMEDKVRRLFTDEMMQRHRGLSDPDVECRSSTCRLSVGYTQELKNTLLATEGQGATVLGYLINEIGPYARSVMPVPAVGNELRDTFVLTFGEEDIDPASYHQWVDKMLAVRQRRAEKAQAEKLAKQAGPALPARQ